MSDFLRFFRGRNAALATAVAGSLFTSSVAAGPYLLVDVKSGQVLVESDAGVPWYPASVTKLMTTYLAFQAMRERKVEPLTLLTVSERAAAEPPSKMGFNVGAQVTLDNAIKMLMVRSANDIAVVIAEGIGGSYEAFIADMNRTAARLGMTGTHFRNPHGLPDENQVTTARDMAILSRALIQEFPEYEFYFRIPAIQIGKRVIRNHNRLIDRYPGADGMKTGFICSSGFNMVAGATRDGRRLLAVVFGAYSAVQRAEDAARLLERGFRPDLAFGEIGSLETIRNLTGAPHDMRDEMCNPKRKRPVVATNLDFDDDEAEQDRVIDAVAKEGAAKAAKQKQASTAKAPARASLLGELSSSMPPIRVFTGPPRNMPDDELVITPEEAEGVKPMPPPRQAPAGKASAPAKATPVAASSKAPAKAAPAKTAQPKK